MLLSQNIPRKTTQRDQRISTHIRPRSLALFHENIWSCSSAFNRFLYMTNPACPAGACRLCISALFCSAPPAVLIISYGQCLTIPRSRHEAASQFLNVRHHRGVRCGRSGSTAKPTTTTRCCLRKGQELPNHIAHHANTPVGGLGRLANEILHADGKAMLGSTTTAWQLQLDVFGSLANRE